MTTRIPDSLAPLVLLLGALLLAPAAGAAEDDAPPPIDLVALQKDREVKARKFPLDQRVSRYLVKAGDLLAEEKTDEAEALLLKLEERRLTPYDFAYVYRLLGVIAYTAEKPDKAIEYFQKVLDLQMLPVRDEAKLRFTIAQLHAQREEWAEVVRRVDEWRRYVVNPDPAAIYLKALAHHQLGESEAAISNVKEAIALSNEPRENWMRMLYALYADKQDYDNAIPVLKDLLVKFPKKEYWIQLSLLFRASDSFEDSLAALQVAYQQGYLTEDKELRRLARSYLYHQLPYKAAQVLEKGLSEGVVEADADAYQVLSDAWVTAREYDKALPPLRKAAELSDEGNLYARLGQVLMQREQWKEAAAALRQALEKGGLRNRGNAVLLLGIASYNDQQVGEAQRYFARAREFEDTRAAAENWINHIDREQGGGDSGPS